MPYINTQEVRLPPPLHERVREVERKWDQGSWGRRFWSGDESLWTSSGEGNWLGWLRVLELSAGGSDLLHEFAEHVRGSIH